jgi:hypothetical protein
MCDLDTGWRRRHGSMIGWAFCRLIGTFSTTAPAR